jgi:PPK2 family polyphosphate:nucleotide phosphotransferase
MAAKSVSESGQALIRSVVDPFRFAGVPDFRLSRQSTDETAGLGKDKAKKLLEANTKRLRDLQERLYAEGRWSVLLIFQGMDAAGKDSAIEHVMQGVNPQGCDVHSFKVPTSKELAHDFLWRSAVALPERGRIGIFNRSYYEELLVVRVHRDILANQKLPPELVTRNIWRERFEDIRAFEQHLARNGTLILKFFLHASKNEQRKRFLDRLEDPTKHWKFEMGDLAERALWDKYQAAYQDVVRHTATHHAPWHVVPADHKWFARLVISSTIVAALEKLDPQYPKVAKVTEARFAQVRRALEAEKARDKAEAKKPEAGKVTPSKANPSKAGDAQPGEKAAAKAAPDVPQTDVGTDGNAT